MARPKRILLPNKTYLTSQPGQKDQFLFLDDEDRQTFRRLARTVAAFYKFDLLRIFIQPTGVLQLLRAPDPTTISRYESQVKSQYSRYLNVKYCLEPRRLLEGIPFPELLPEPLRQRPLSTRESNWRPRFAHRLVLPEHLSVLRSVGWEVAVLSGIETDQDTEFLPALECCLEGYPPLCLPTPMNLEPLLPGPSSSTPAPICAKNSPHWRWFLIQSMEISQPSRRGSPGGGLPPNESITPPIIST
jgi:hypothetical protein